MCDWLRNPRMSLRIVHLETHVLPGVSGTLSVGTLQANAAWFRPGVRKIQQKTDVAWLSLVLKRFCFWHCYDNDQNIRF